MKKVFLPFTLVLMGLTLIFTSCSKEEEITQDDQNFVTEIQVQTKISEPLSTNEDSITFEQMRIAGLVFQKKQFNEIIQLTGAVKINTVKTKTFYFIKKTGETLYWDSDHGIGFDESNNRVPGWSNICPGGGSGAESYTYFTGNQEHTVYRYWTSSHGWCSAGSASEAGNYCD